MINLAEWCKTCIGWREDHKKICSKIHSLSHGRTDRCLGCGIPA